MRVLWFGSVLAFGIVVAAAGWAITLPIPLYPTKSCAPGYCFPNIPVIPIVALGAGIAVTFAQAVARGARRGPSDALRGLGIGVLAALYVGLTKAAQLPFEDPYFGTVYRLYGLAYLALVSFAAAAWLARALSGGPSPERDLFAWPLGAAVIAAILLAAVERHVTVAGTAALAGASGAAYGVVTHRRRFGWPIAAHTDARRALLAIVLIAFVLRAFFGLSLLARTGPGLDFAHASDDGDNYFLYASQAASGISEVPVVLRARPYPPGYALFLGAIFAATGGSLGAAVLFQSGLAAIAALLVWLIARRVTGPVPAFVATGLFALDQNLVQNAATLTPESLALPLALAAIWALLRYADRPATRWIAIAGACLGLTYLTRNVMAPPLLVAGLAWIAVRRRPVVAAVREGATMLALAIAVASPVGFSNLVAGLGFDMTTQRSALTWEWDDPSRPGLTIPNRFLVDRGIVPFTDPLGSLSRALADPLPIVGFYLTAAPQRLATLLFFPGLGASDPITIANGSHYANPFGDLVELLLWAGLVVTVGARLRRGRPTEGGAILLGGYVLLYVAVFVFVFPPYQAFRYRIPIEPLLLVAQAAGVVVLARWVLRKAPALP